MSEKLSLQDIRQARERMQGLVHSTPLDKSITFSKMTGCEMFLKLENMQKTGSFKIRGAFNKIGSLTEEERSRGVIAASAGNHAQGVAYAAAMAGVRATIIMPETAPLAKSMATRGYGAEVVLHGSVYDDAFHKAWEIAGESGQTFINAFNDYAVMAGQGTIGLEILEALPDVSAIVVPIGGGGLIAGIATAVKQLAPHVKVYGVQAQGAPAMYLSQHNHQLETTASAATIADGIAVKAPGDLTFPIVEQHVDDIVIVDDEIIASTILLLLERAKIVVEGAGAVSLAAVLNEKIPAKGKIVSIISGGNIDMNFISRIIERGLVKAGRRVRISVSVIDRPGVLQQVLTVIASHRGNVISVFHERIERNVPIGKAIVEITLEARDALHTEEILGSLKHAGFEAKII